VPIPNILHNAAYFHKLFKVGGFPEEGIGSQAGRGFPVTGGLGGTDYNHWDISTLCALPHSREYLLAAAFRKILIQ
jgi:hypothetical protein